MRIQEKYSIMCGIQIRPVHDWFVLVLYLIVENSRWHKFSKPIREPSNTKPKQFQSTLYLFNSPPLIKKKQKNENKNKKQTKQNFYKHRSIFVLVEMFRIWKFVFHVLFCTIHTHFGLHSHANQHGRFFGGNSNSTDSFQTETYSQTFQFFF